MIVLKLVLMMKLLIDDDDDGDDDDDDDDDYGEKSGVHEFGEIKISKVNNNLPFHT